MTNFLHARETTLSAFLKSGPVFVMPAYQRNYQWGQGERSDFWSDIMGTLAKDRLFYFLGSFVLDSRDESELHVVDGQQRLTTASLLLTALRNSLWSEGELSEAERLEKDYLLAPDQDGPPCRLTLNKQDQAFYNDLVTTPRKLNAIKDLGEQGDISESNKNLADCLAYMHQEIAIAVEQGTPLRELTTSIEEALEKKVVLIQIDVRSDIDAFVVFETLNDRGLDLNAADLLKNHLISMAEDKRDEVIANWEEMAGNLGPILPINFLQHHWCSTRARIEKKHIYKVVRNHMQSARAVVNYSEELASASLHYAALSDIRNPLWNKLPETERERAGDMIRFINLIGTKPQHIVLLATFETDINAMADMLEMLAIFTFRFGKICNNPPSKVESRFVQAANFVRQQKVGDLSAKEVFRRYFANLYPSDDAFQKAFALHRKQETGMARYILAKINDHMAGLAPNTTLYDRQAATVEHVLPIKYIKSWGKRPSGFGATPENYIWRLGNLTLLPEKVNHSIGNAKYSEKQKAYRANKLAITKGILKHNIWSAKAIDTRQRQLANIASKLWCYPAKPDKS